MQHSQSWLLLVVFSVTHVLALDAPVTNYGAFTPGREVSDAVIRTNTTTLQRALDEVGKAGGGTVQVPAGTYRVSAPSLSDDWPSAVLIRYDNLVLAGAGMSGAGRTTLVFRGMYLTDASGRAIGRGHGIRFVGTSGTPRRNVGVRDIELDGDGRDERDVGGYTGTGNIDWISENGTRYGWDTSHKGIIVTANDNLDNVTITNVDVHDFRGEVVYGGGYGLGRLTIRGCRIANSQADLMSLTADMICEDTLFDRTAIAWTENAMIRPNSSMIWRRCIFRRADIHGIVLAQSPRNLPIPPGIQAVIEDCELSDCPEGGVDVFGGTRNVVVRRNRFTDVAYGLFTSADNFAVTFSHNHLRGVTRNTAIANIWSQMDGFTITDNVCENATSLPRGNAAFLYAGDISNTVFRNNTIIRGRLPERSSDLSDQRPLIANNVYRDFEDRRTWSGSSSGAIAEPQHETLQVTNSGSAASITVGLATAGYRDGQPLRVIGGSSARSVRLVKNGSGLNLAADRVLDGSTTVRLVFRSADQKWHDDTSALPQPTITLTQPTAGGSVTQGAAVALSATATAGEGTVEKVEFFVNGTKVGEDLRIAHPGPWSSSWTPSTVGVAEIRAVVTNTAGRTLSTGIVTVTVAASGVTNTPPTITALSDVTVTSGASTPAIPFTIADAQTAATALTVTGASSNTALVPLANVVFAGTGANRTVVVTPVNGLTGSSVITVTVSDGTATAARSFVLTVTAAPDTTAPARPAAPTVTNAGTARPTFSGTSEPGAIMSLYANGSLIGSVTAGSSGTWTWTPGSDLPAGTHQITLIATDTAGNASSASPATTVTVAGGATGGPGPGATGSDSGSKGGSCGVGSASAWMVSVLMLMAMSLGVRCRRRD